MARRARTRQSHALDLGYITQSDFNSLYAQANTLCAKIYRLIQSLTTSLTYKKL